MSTNTIMVNIGTGEELRCVWPDGPGDDALGANLTDWNLDVFDISPDLKNKIFVEWIDAANGVFLLTIKPLPSTLTSSFEMSFRIRITPVGNPDLARTTRPVLVSAK